MRKGPYAAESEFLRHLRKCIGGCALQNLIGVLSLRRKFLDLFLLYLCLAFEDMNALFACIQSLLQYEHCVRDGFIVV